MTTSRRIRAIFGDFQTPIELAREVTDFVLKTGNGFSTVVEPTCGVAEHNVWPASKAAFDMALVYLLTCLSSSRP